MSGYISAAGSGGGGSSLDTGVQANGQTGYNSGNGFVAITPVVGQPNVSRYTVVGEQCPNSPFGWELSNGIISITPLFSATRLAFVIRGWNNQKWSTGKQWRVTDDGTSTGVAAAVASSFAIVKNSPEECIVRVTAEYTGRKDAITMTIALRRGSPLADFTMSSAVNVKWGMSTDVWQSSTGLTGLGLVETAADTEGLKIFGVTAYPATRAVSFNNSFHLGTANINFVVALGYVTPGMSETPQNMIYQWYADMSEMVKAVIR